MSNFLKRELRPLPCWDAPCEACKAKTVKVQQEELGEAPGIKGLYLLLSWL